MKKYILAIVAAGIWMNISEFIRNEFLIKHIWVDGFKAIGLTFPAEPINGMIWGLWAFIFVSILAWLTSRYNALESTLIAWVIGFALLWLGMWNMGVLPGGLLQWAVPWSFVEVYVAALICSYLVNKEDNR